MQRFTQPLRCTGIIHTWDFVKKFMCRMRDKSDTIKFIDNKCFLIQRKYVMVVKGLTTFIYSRN